MAALTPQWPDLTDTEAWAIWGIPLATFVLFLIIFNVWPVDSKGKSKTSSDGKPTELTGLLQKTDKVIRPGQANGDYSADWTTTFDLTILIFMTLSLGLLVVLTSIYKPSLWTNPIFWAYQAPKPIVMIVVSMGCGMICRALCDIDDKGYIQTNESSWFKVNYTRKVQHFMAYLVPLIVQTPESCNCEGTLETFWGQWLTVATFALMIKPVRESMKIFMLQFNSLDRPEDRPETLKWILVGNIIPGSLMILFWKAVFPEANSNLVLIFVFVTGIGDGLAEPVGITWGKHKYQAKGFQFSYKDVKEIVNGKEVTKKEMRFLSDTAYERSFEGSACVFLSGMLFTSMQHAYFNNSTEFWVCFWVQGPLMAYAEAVSPHTMDTPFLMGLGGLSIYLIITFL
jgi:dolichol kinase